MAFSKIILNGNTLMDVTGDTVNANNLLSPETATRNDGVRVTGSVDLSTYVLKAGDTMTGILKMKGTQIRYEASDNTDLVHLVARATGAFTIQEETSTGYENYNFPAPTATSGTNYSVLTTKPGAGAVYAAGDTFTTSTAASQRPIWNGFSASNDKTLYLCVYVDKSLDAISSISVTTLTGGIFGTDGPIENSTTTTDWVSNYNVTAVKAADKIVRIAITKKDSTVFTNSVAYTAINGSLNTVLTFA